MEKSTSASPDLTRGSLCPPSSSPVGVAEGLVGVEDGNVSSASDSAVAAMDNRDDSGNRTSSSDTPAGYRGRIKSRAQ